MVYVIPTIDVEAAHGVNPVDDMIWGKKGYGIKKIVQILKDYGLTATFFVDVYEKSYWGDKMREVVNFLLSSEQDVELHTHPAWKEDKRDFWNKDLVELKRNQAMFDPDRPWMHMYSFEEQSKIIKIGKEILRNYGVADVVAHRSGGYSINVDTLKALAINDIPIDMSIFPGHPNTKINFGENNNVFSIDTKYGEIIEIPVTHVDAIYEFMGFRLKRIMKTDLDWVSLNTLVSVLKTFLEYAINEGIDIVYVLFMHSYSLLNMNYKMRRFAPDKFDENKLKKFLEVCLGHSEIKIISVRELYHNVLSSRKNLQRFGKIPFTTVRESFMKKFIKKIYREVITYI